MRPVTLPSLAVALLLAAAPLRAEVSPDALWSALQDGTPLITATGGEASPSSGDGISVADPVLSMGQGDMVAEISADSMTLSAEGDGTRMTLPDSFTVRRNGVAFEVNAPGLALIATGEADAPSYSIDAPRLTARGPGIADAELVLSLAGASGRIGAEKSGISAKAVAVEMSGASGNGPGDIIAERSDVRLDLNGTPATLFSRGADPMDLSVRAGSGTQRITGQGPGGESLTLDFAFAESEETLASDGQTVSVRQSARDMSLSATGSAVPLPDASVTIAESRLATDLPLPSTESRPFAVEIALSGMAPSEQIWQFVDPSGALPREGADLSLRLAGDASTGPEGALLPERVALEDLNLTFLGASVSGQGAVTFIEQPVPGESPGRPVGAIAFDLNGVTGLLEKLSSLGTVPPGPLMGARMGLGFLTRPGDGPDSLQSEVEFAPDGQVVVNGRPIGALPGR